MRANCWMGKGSVSVREVPDPEILNDGDAIVKISSTAICGSDLHLYNGLVPTMKSGDVLGHEFMGEIVEIEYALPGREVTAQLAKLVGQAPEQLLETGEIVVAEGALQGVGQPPAGVATPRPMREARSMMGGEGR